MSEGKNYYKRDEESRRTRDVLNIEIYLKPSLVQSTNESALEQAMRSPEVEKYTGKESSSNAVIYHDNNKGDESRQDKTEQRRLFFKRRAYLEIIESLIKNPEGARFILEETILESIEQNAMGSPEVEKYTGKKSSSNAVIYHDNNKGDESRQDKTEQRKAISLKNWLRQFLPEPVKSSCRSNRNMYWDEHPRCECGSCRAYNGGAPHGDHVHGPNCHCVFCSDNWSLTSKLAAENHRRGGNSCFCAYCKSLGLC